MCGRYFFSIPQTLEGKKFKAFIEQYNLYDYEQGEIFPSQQVLALIYQNQQYQPKIMSWGMQAGKHRVINARSETIHEKAMFRSYLNQRCAIPCNAFYEWKRIDEKKKEKYRIQDRSEDMMYMAGLYANNELVLLTGESQGIMKEIHHRTPILMNKNEMFRYLRHQFDPPVNNEQLEMIKEDKDARGKKHD